MRENTPNSRKSFRKGHSKYSKTSDLKTVLSYLNNHIATGSMVCKNTTVEHKNFTRRKRTLEDAGLLQEVKQGLCKVTNQRAWYLTTNKNLFKYPYKANKDKE